MQNWYFKYRKKNVRAFFSLFDSFWQFFRQFSELFSDLLFGKGFPQFFFDNYLDLVSRSFKICKVDNFQFDAHYENKLTKKIRPTDIYQILLDI